MSAARRPVPSDRCVQALKTAVAAACTEAFQLLEFPCALVPCRARDRADSRARLAHRALVLTPWQRYSTSYIRRFKRTRGNTTRHAGRPRAASGAPHGYLRISDDRRLFLGCSNVSRMAADISIVKLSSRGANNGRRELHSRRCPENPPFRLRCARVSRYLPWPRVRRGRRRVQQGRR